ncbi:hypothetical protein U9M48_041760, partial [Paspalum notatum var. saurae]
ALPPSSSSPRAAAASSEFTPMYLAAAEITPSFCASCSSSCFVFLELPASIRTYPKSRTNKETEPPAGVIFYNYYF